MSLDFQPRRGHDGNAALCIAAALMICLSKRDKASKICISDGNPESSTDRIHANPRVDMTASGPDPVP